MIKQSWFKRHKIAGVLAGVFFIVGFLFIDKSVTGNVVLEQGYYINPISLVGLLFIFCSAVLTLHAIKR